ALLVVDGGNDRRREVQDLLELARCDVEQVADAARHALEEPDVRDGRGQVDVSHALAAHLLARHLDAAALADDALVPDALVLAAVALPVLRRTENALAEEPVALRLERAVVDGLRLGYLARGPVADLLAGRKPDSNRIEIVDIQSALAPSFCQLVGSSRSVFELEVGEALGERARLGLRLFLCLLAGRDLDVVEILERLVGREGELAVPVDPLLALLDLLRVRRAGRGAQRSGREVDAELLGCAEELVLLLAHLDLA